MKWLPKRSISRTWKYLEKPRAPASAAAEERRPAAERAQERAVEFATIMATQGLSRAGLARKLGVSRAWVTKVLRSPLRRKPAKGSEATFRLKS